jgi:UDP:flavonoid glycosyltransferase YjiC (YdhE family)
VLGALPDAVAAYRATLDAVANLDARVLLTVGDTISIDTLPAPPPHVHIQAWVAQEQVLPAAGVVVAHGGSGTTFGALAFGVPLVLVPFFADQPADSDRGAATGAALIVSAEAGPGATAFTRLEPARLCAAIETVLANPRIDAPRATSPPRCARPPRSTRSSTRWRPTCRPALGDHDVLAEPWIDRRPGGEGEPMPLGGH